MTRLNLMLLLIVGMVSLFSAPLWAKSDTAIDQLLASPQRLQADRERDLRSRPDVILSMLDLKPGDRVADIFAGAGYYSELLGGIVGSGGEVLMHNNEAYISFVGKALDERFNGRALPGVVRHDREVADLDLGQNVLDAVIIIMSYHDLYHTADGWPAIDADDFMGQITRALKPGGRFLLVDHAAADGTGKESAQQLHRIEESFVRRDVARFGLEFVAANEVLRNPADDHSITAFAPEVRGRTDRFVLLFRKP
jgi:predicted methyltransferase